MALCVTIRPFLVVWRQPRPGPYRSVSRSGAKGQTPFFLDDILRQRDLAAERGVRALVADPGLGPSSDPNWRERAAAAVDDHARHEGLFACYVHDEPMLDDFEAVGEMVASIREQDADHHSARSRQVDAAGASPRPLLLLAARAPPLLLPLSRPREAPRDLPSYWTPAPGERDLASRQGTGSMPSAWGSAGWAINVDAAATVRCGGVNTIAVQVTGTMKGPVLFFSPRRPSPGPP